MLKNKRQGMTLIEVMIVVLIIGIVFATSVFMGSTYAEKAKYARASEDLDAIAKAVNFYVLNYDDGRQDSVYWALDSIRVNRGKLLDKWLNRPLANIKTPWGEDYTWAVGPGSKYCYIYCVKTNKSGTRAVAVDPSSGEKMQRRLNFDN